MPSKSVGIAKVVKKKRTKHQNRKAQISISNNLLVGLIDARYCSLYGLVRVPFQQSKHYKGYDDKQTSVHEIKFSN
jgi:hypothetical protein